MEFVFARLIFTLRLDRDCPDPYSLFGIRNFFKDVFRNAVCQRQGQCETCREKDCCSYHHAFSQAISNDRLAVKRHQKPSLPFVFDLAPVPDQPNEGDEVEIGMNLAGSAITYARDYITAVCQLFRQDGPAGTVRGTVIKVESETCSGFRNSIMQNGGTASYDAISTISARDLAETRTLDQNRVRLTVTTPIRLMGDGKPVRDFAFSSFVRALMRRISSLAYYYYGGGLDYDYGWLSSISTSIVISENDFRWTRWDEDRRGEWLSGITGSGTCEGMLVDFHPFLLLGEYFHVGKGSPYGLGRYRIEKNL
ncbi:MAG: hypothetical protein H6Q57_1014 [Geobacteraceae bacterium]|nr:hypothetical protein [Geobacteraceae bacterium]